MVTDVELAGAGRVQLRCFGTGSALAMGNEMRM